VSRLNTELTLAQLVLAIQRLQILVISRQRPKFEIDRVGRGSQRVGFVNATAHCAQRLPLVLGLALLSRLFHF